MSKQKKVQLSKAFTWGGVNYAPGSVELPEAAAAYAVKRGFGKSGGDSAASETSAGFKPLSRDETMKRFMEGDSSDEVFESLKFHQQALVEEQNRNKAGDGETGINANSKSKDEETGGNSGDSEGGSQSENPPAGLPEDFPMEHIFSKPNKLSETGFTSVADIQKFSREELISIDGIAEKTADKALAYGK